MVGSSNEREQTHRSYLLYALISKKAKKMTWNVPLPFHVNLSSINLPWYQKGMQYVCQKHLLNIVLRSCAHFRFSSLHWHMFFSLSLYHHFTLSLSFSSFVFLLPKYPHRLFHCNHSTPLHTLIFPQTLLIYLLILVHFQ